MLLHTSDLDTLKQGEALGALVKARNSGKFRFIDYSGDNEAVAYAAGHDDVDVIETLISICDHAHIENVLPLAIKKNVGLLAKRLIANSAWTDPSVSHGIYVGCAKPYSQRLAGMGISSEDLGFFGDTGAARPEIALQFTLAQAGVSTMVVGITKLTNVQRNLEISAKGPLPADAVIQIRNAFKCAEADSGEPWAANS